jgi:hypothetical protein
MEVITYCKDILHIHSNLIFMTSDSGVEAYWKLENLGENGVPKYHALWNFRNSSTYLKR